MKMKNKDIESIVRKPIRQEDIRKQELQEIELLKLAKDVKITQYKNCFVVRAKYNSGELKKNGFLAMTSSYSKWEGQLSEFNCQYGQLLQEIYNKQVKVVKS